MKREVEIPARRVCSLCDEVVTDPHVHNVWALSHSRLIEQRSVAGLNLEPANFAVIAYAAWVDMGMSRVYCPPVGLS